MSDPTSHPTPPSDNSSQIALTRWLILAIAVLALGGIGLRVLLAGDDSSPSTAAPTTQAPSPLPQTYIPPTLAPYVSPTSGVMVGQPAPDVPLRNLDDETFTLADFQEDRWLVLNFWATWCVPCVNEMPALQAYYEAQDGAVAVLSVTDPDSDQTLTGIQRFLDENDLKRLPIGLDQGRRLHVAVGISALPTTLFIDPDGIIQRRWTGEITRDEVQAVVEDLASP